MRYDEEFPEENLNDFCLATVGYSVRLPGIARISTNQFRDMKRHVETLISLGYQRPGIWIPKVVDGRVERQFSAGFTTAYAALDQTPPEVLSDEAPKAARLRRWIKGNKIDVVIGLPAHFKLLRAAGFEIPENLGFSALDWHGGREVANLAGMDYQPEQLFREAINALHAAHLANRRGQLDSPPLVLFDASYRTGLSVNDARREIRTKPSTAQQPV